MMRKLKALVIATIGIALLVGTHVYVVRRLILDADLGRAGTAAGILTIVALGAIPFVRALGGSRLSEAMASRLTRVSYLWIGLFWLLLAGTFLSDVALGLSSRVGILDSLGASPLALDRGRAFAVIAFALVAGGVGVAFAFGKPKTERVDVRLSSLPGALDGFRIVQVSDVHIGPVLDGRFATRLANRVNELDADLVAITGDLVDGSVERISREVAPLGELRARHGVFFVTGNHDRYSDADAWSGHLETLGFRSLRNEHVSIGANGASFDLAGIDDEWGTRFMPGKREGLERALANRSPGRAVVLLAHNPASFAHAHRMGVDLQLSGHTHGGQIWPFGWFVWIFHRWTAGLYERDRSQLYVSRGTGFWGPPIRFPARPEITEIVLRSATQ